MTKEEKMTVPIYPYCEGHGSLTHQNCLVCGKIIPPADAELGRLREMVAELETKNCFTHGTFDELYRLRRQVEALERLLCSLYSILPHPLAWRNDEMRVVKEVEEYIRRDEALKEGR